MTVKISKLLLLVVCLASPTMLVAQTDSVAFDQARLRIWCETARFVYDDNGADSLLASINCQSWESLRSSVKSTDASLGVTRLMSSVDKPAIYKGFSTNEARLQKLVGEISSRLKQSSVRRASEQRLNRVDSLEQQLRLFARHAGTGGAPAAYYAPSPGMTNAARDTFDADEMYPAADLTDEETTTSNNPMPWNEILQWLALLLLGGVLFWRLRDTEQRYSRLKRDFRTLEKQVNEFMINTVSPGSMHTSVEPMSENEVRNVVKEEPQQPKPVAKNLPFAEKAAVHSNPSPAPLQEAAPPAEPLPATSKPAPYVPAADQDEDTGVYYDKMPFKGGFHQNEMSRERQRDSLYTIKLAPGQAGEAEYWVTEDAEVQRYAMQNGLSFFEEGCDFDEVKENPVRVVNELTGWLQKEGAVWKIVEKAKVRFE